MSGSSESAKSGVKDFDFLIGKWKILNKRLKDRLRGTNEWEELYVTANILKASA